MKKSDIIDAYCRIRTIDNTIPDDVLDFMKQSALDAVENKTHSCRDLNYEEDEDED